MKITNLAAGTLNYINYTAGNDIIGGNGNITVMNTAVNSIIELGNGNDSVTTFTGTTVKLGDGRNIVSAAGGNNNVTVGNGANNITLSGQGNVLTTGSGSNTITVGTPADIASHQTTVQISSATLNLGSGKNMVFLNGAGSTVNAGSGTTTVTETAGGNNTYVLAKAGGTLGVTGFDATHGDHLDLSKILAGINLAPDMSDLGNYVSVAAVADPTHAGQVNTVLNIAGSSGQETVTLYGSGALTLANLEQGALVLPSH
jgi:hypothetical protein